ncbi:NUDIX hydrolase [Actinomadura kijaniata]|uniref:NUDIX hydrolase n=1 Tax=Actinomadura kijaniata TaxID=46161 RepID=UPI00082BAFA9|nr:NUDIX hydrolase [Actinomadura kijaniata]
MAEVVSAAGTLLWRGSGTGAADGPEIAVIHRPRYDDWTFAKGKVDPGEHVLRAAVRETVEETGIVPRLGRRLPTVTYPLRDGRTKRVDWWAAEPAASASFTPNEEVDEVAWLTPARAAERLSYSHEVDLLHELLAGPRATRPLIILRHVSAGEKRAWSEPDELRPLDERGRAQATALADLLPCYGPARVVSSATARCVDTALPYARRARVTVTTDEAFTVGGTGSAVERLLALAADRVPTIVCTHGEIVTELVTGLCRELGEKAPEDPALPKGGFWTAQLTGEGAPAVVSLERHD